QAQRLVQRGGLVDHPRRLTDKGILEAIEGRERRRVAGAFADVNPEPGVPVLAVVQGQFQHRGEIEQDGRAGAVEAAVAARLDAADDAVVARLLQTVALARQRFDYRTIVVQRGRGTGVQIHLAQAAQVDGRIDPRIVAGV